MGQHIKQLKLNFALLAILLVASCPQYSLSQRNIDSKLQERIDDYIQSVYLPSAGVFSLGLAITKDDGELLYTTGYGFADVEREVPVDNTTQFSIGSITKSMTAVVTVKILSERFPHLGEAVLDTPIRKLLPEINFTLSDRFRSEQLTFRDLLAHRVCLRIEDTPVLAGAFETRDEYFYGSRYSEEFCGVRSEFSYNNRMYMVAGELAGMLANKPYQEMVQELFSALGMNNSTFAKETDDYSQMPYRAMPYYIMEGVSHIMNTSLVGRIGQGSAAGGVFATPDDMAKYIRFLMNLGNLDGRQIVSKDVMEWMRKPANIIPQQNFRQSNSTDLIVSRFAYGLGLFQGSYDGWEYISHDGFFIPYASLMSLFPAKKLAIFSTTNMGPLKLDHVILHTSLYNIIEGFPETMEKVSKLQKQLEAEEKLRSSLDRQKFEAFLRKVKENSKVQKKADIVGEYASGSLGELNIVEKFNEGANEMQYYMEYGIWYRGWLEEILPGVHYRLHFDTDAVHDEYALGSKESRTQLILDGDKLYLFQDGSSPDAINKFTRGLRRDLLPPVPWNPDSCGPEEA